MGVEVRDANDTEKPKSEAKRTIGEYESNGMYTVDKNLEEAKKHPDGEKLNYEDIDGDPLTKSHEHIGDEFVIKQDGSKYTYAKLAERWGFYKDGEPDSEYVKEWIKEQQEKDVDITVDEIIEQGDREHEDPRAPKMIREKQ